MPSFRDSPDQVKLHVRLDHMEHHFVAVIQEHTAELDRLAREAVKEALSEENIKKEIAEQALQAVRSALARKSQHLASEEVDRLHDRMRTAAREAMEKVVGEHQAFQKEHGIR